MRRKNRRGEETQGPRLFRLRSSGAGVSDADRRVDRIGWPAAWSFVVRQLSRSDGHAAETVVISERARDGRFVQVGVAGSVRGSVRLFGGNAHGEFGATTGAVVARAGDAA